MLYYRQILFASEPLIQRLAMGDIYSLFTNVATPPARVIPENHQVNAQEKILDEMV